MKLGFNLPKAWPTVLCAKLPAMQAQKLMMSVTLGAKEAARQGLVDELYTTGD